MMFGLEKLTAKAIGVGVLAVVLILCVIGLINYGTKLGRAQAEIERLEGELVKADAWKEDALTKMRVGGKSAEEWKIAYDTAEEMRLAIIAQPPEIVTRWRDRIREVPVEIQLGNCDRAAASAWDVLKDSGLIGERTWEDTSYVSPLRPGFSEDVARLNRLLTPPTLNMYLSSSLPRRPNVYVGTYHLSSSPIWPEMP